MFCCLRDELGASFVFHHNYVRRTHLRYLFTGVLEKCVRSLKWVGNKIEVVVFFIKYYIRMYDLFFDIFFSSIIFSSVESYFFVFQIRTYIFSKFEGTFFHVKVCCECHLQKCTHLTSYKMDFWFSFWEINNKCKITFLFFLVVMLKI